MQLAFALTVTDDECLSGEDEVTVTVTRAAAPLTAQFEQVPSAHEGVGNTFAVRLAFSEAVNLNIQSICFPLPFGRSSILY